MVNCEIYPTTLTNLRLVKNFSYPNSVSYLLINFMYKSGRETFTKKKKKNYENRGNINCRMAKRKTGNNLNIIISTQSLIEQSPFSSEKKKMSSNLICSCFEFFVILPIYCTYFNIIKIKILVT